MSLFRKKQKNEAAASPAQKQAGTVMPSQRLAHVFQRMYLWVLSVNLNYDVYQVESGSPCLGDTVFAERGKFSQLPESLSGAVQEQYLTSLQQMLSPAELKKSFLGGKNCVSTVICYVEESERKVRGLELRIERIPDPSPNVLTALVYARQMQSENDREEIGKVTEPAADHGPIDWTQVRAERAAGIGAIRFEYEVAADRLILHKEQGDAEYPRFLGTLDARSDYFVAHNSLQPLRRLLENAIDGEEGSDDIALRINAGRGTGFTHYRVTVYPLELDNAPTWLFGSLMDVEQTYQQRLSLQEINMELSAIIEQVFRSLYIVDTDRNTIRPLVKNSKGYYAGDYVRSFTKYLEHGLECGIVAPESSENIRRLMQRGFLDRKASRTPFEIELRMKLPGTVDFLWYTDTFSPIPNNPHRYMLARRNSDDFHAAKDREYASAEASRMTSYNQFILDYMAGLVEFRNTEIGPHIDHVRSISRIIMNDLARRSPQYEMDNKTIERYCFAATIHDIGKIAIPDAILNKNGRLTVEEYEFMKRHTIEGCRIISNLSLPGWGELKQACVDVALHHHERWDGKGYPDGLIGDENTIYVQVIGIADVYDALVSERCYKKGFSHDEAVAIITGGNSGAFNPRVIDSFLHCGESIRQVYSGIAAEETTEEVYG